ncbi:hypothetical protein OBBRIDRAFT_803747 [Obba rivulosa]|uniref:Uncharacterized protein n=1 Tax=Obba rivulosa TaxID=1052685 RepID=A0A8E2DL73_9APHY|nr:hypothetical protein OBBRIDRAFT_803747 [Obba rivulosa]
MAAQPHHRRDFRTGLFKKHSNGIACVVRPSRERVVLGERDVIHSTLESRTQETHGDDQLEFQRSAMLGSHSCISLIQETNECKNLAATTYQTKVMISERKSSLPETSCFAGVCERPDEPCAHVSKMWAGHSRDTLGTWKGFNSKQARAALLLWRGRLPSKLPVRLRRIKPRLPEDISTAAGNILGLDALSEVPAAMLPETRAQMADDVNVSSRPMLVVARVKARCWHGHSKAPSAVQHKFSATGTGHPFAVDLHFLSCCKPCGLHARSGWQGLSERSLSASDRILTLLRTLMSGSERAVDRVHSAKPVMEGRTPGSWQRPGLSGA